MPAVKFTEYLKCHMSNFIKKKKKKAECSFSTFQAFPYALHKHSLLLKSDQTRSDESYVLIVLCKY